MSTAPDAPTGSPTGSTAGSTTWLAAASLWRRELVRFVREPSRVVSAAATPLVFWLLLGSGFSGAFRMPGAAGQGAAGEGAAGPSFLQFFYPGTVVLVLLFAAIFSTISLIEDRREGFLQGVLAAPVSRLGIVAGKVAGGATLAWLQGALFLLVAPAVGVPLAVGPLAAAAGVLALLAVQLAALGFACAWRTSSVQGFHAVMNLLLIPLWLLSGAFFPVASAPPWLAAAMRANPLTYGVAALRGTLHGDPGAGLPGLPVALAVTALVTAAALALAWTSARSGRVR